MFTNHDITPVSSTVELFFSFFFRLCPPGVRGCVRGAEVAGRRAREGGGGEGQEAGGDQQRDETVALPPHL